MIQKFYQELVAILKLDGDKEIDLHEFLSIVINLTLIITNIQAIKRNNGKNKTKVIRTYLKKNYQGISNHHPLNRHLSQL